MTKAQDNLFPYISVVETSVPANPAAGNQRIYIDPADHKIKLVNSSGTVTSIDPSTITSLATTLALTGDITPTQITSNQNDYNPTNLATSTVLRLSTDASRNITGLQGGADGRIIVIYNVGSQSIVLKNNDAGSSAANRFSMSADVTLAANDGIILIYDSTASLWKCIGKSPGGTSGGSGRTLIQSQTPTGTGTVSFTSITNTYVKLELEYLVKSTNNTDSVTMKIEINNDTTAANYRTIRIDRYATTTSGDGAADDNVINDGVLGSATGHTNEASFGILELPFYTSAFNKQVISHHAQRRDTTTNQEQLDLRGCNWENNAAINRIDLILSAGNFATGSTINLYGLP